MSEAESKMYHTLHKRQAEINEPAPLSGEGGESENDQGDPLSIRCTNCKSLNFYVWRDAGLGGLVLKCVACGWIQPKEQKLVASGPSVSSEETRYLKLLRWFKLFYNFYQKDIANKISACASALSEDAELQELVNESRRID